VCGATASRNSLNKDSTQAAGESSQKQDAVAAIAALAAISSEKDHLDVPLTAEQIHPFRVLKHAPNDEDSHGAGGGAPVAASALQTETFSMKQEAGTKKQSQSDLLKYFDRVHSQSKNPARRQQQQKMASAAMKRAAMQQQADASAVPAPTVTEPPQTHPHLLAFLQEQLALQAEENGHLMQVDSSTAGTETPATTTATDTPATPAASTAPETTATAADGTTTTNVPVDTTTAPATGGTGPVPVGDTVEASTGGEASTGADAVTNSVVPLSHLEELQKELAAVEAEHAKRQTELSAELAAQQAQTRDLLEREKQGTVGLTVTPILINPEKHLPIDPANAELYNNVPTDDKMNLRPSVFAKAADLENKADAMHKELVNNLPIECAEPTCSIPN